MQFEMKGILPLSAFAVFVLPAPGTFGSDVARDQLLLLHAARVAEVRGSVAAGEGPLADAWAALRARAEAILAAETDYSVTYNESVPASGNPHDYYSTGPYWWPDPESEDGLPYIRRDGEFNPERDRVSDRDPLHNMVGDVRTLAYTFALSGEERFAERAARLVRVWFLDEATHMRPNLNHAQAIPGRVPGRGTGIIDTHVFVYLVDALLLLEASRAWGDADARAMRAWMNDFLDWLLAHPHGRHERRARNNHGSAFDLQAVSLALYTGRTHLARIILEEDTMSRIGAHISVDGRQPLEIARTRSWSYTTENLRHFMRLGLLARHVGVELFGYKAETGGSINVALEFALPYVCDREAWPYEQVTAWQTEYIREVLTVAYEVYPEMKGGVDEALQCLGEPAEEDVFFLQFIRPVRSER